MSEACVRWDDGAVVLLDQTRLPHEQVDLRCTTVATLVDAIRRLVVRGAPALGVAGAYGVALAAVEHRGDPHAVYEAAHLLATARPTAVNLARGVGEVLAAVEGLSGDELAAAALDAARAVAESDRAASAAMATLGLELVPDGARVLTHCNTGALVSAGEGTALAVVLAAHRQGRVARLWIDETRPLLQGARLTAWEAARAGVPHTLLPDNAAGALFAAGEVDLVIVGADRVCADGSVANKVGTYPLAVLARAHGVPFVVVAPTSTIDLSTLTGSGVVIEQRDPSEVTEYAGHPVAPAGTPAFNPAFDVTPAELVTALVTEVGIARPVDAASISALVAAVMSPGVAAATGGG